MFSWICCNLQWTIALRMIGKSTNFSDRHTAPLLFSVDPLLTKKRVDRKKRQLTEIFFYQKPYVLYGIIAMLELVYRSLRRDDQMPNFIFRSIIKFHFGLTEKIFNLRLTKGIIDRKFPTFYIPIYPYKMYIFYCYETFCQELAGKSSPSCPRF